MHQVNKNENVVLQIILQFSALFIFPLLTFEVYFSFTLLHYNQSAYNAVMYFCPLLTIDNVPSSWCSSPTHTKYEQNDKRNFFGRTKWVVLYRLAMWWLCTIMGFYQTGVTVRKITPWTALYGCGISSGNSLRLVQSTQLGWRITAEQD